MSGQVTGRIVITRTLTEDDDLIDVATEPQDMTVIERLGLLELAKGYVIHDEGDDE